MHSRDIDCSIRLGHEIITAIKRAVFNKWQVLLYVCSRSGLYHKTAIWLVKRSGEGAERNIRKETEGKGGEPGKEGGREKGREQERGSGTYHLSLLSTHSGPLGYWCIAVVRWHRIRARKVTPVLFGNFLLKQLGTLPTGETLWLSVNHTNHNHIGSPGSCDPEPTLYLPFSENRQNKDILITRCPLKGIGVERKECKGRAIFLRL